MSACGHETLVRVTELDRVRELCLALPEVTERLSHGSPTWFVRGKKTFVMYLDDHHGDGRLALWCAAPEGMQEALVAGEPDHYFRPPYVGHRGWIGVHLNRGLDWNEIAGAIEDAYAEVAPKTLVEQAGAPRASSLAARSRFATSAEGSDGELPAPRAHRARLVHAALLAQAQRVLDLDHRDHRGGGEDEPDQRPVGVVGDPVAGEAGGDALVLLRA